MHTHHKAKRHDGGVCIPLIKDDIYKKCIVSKL